MLSSLSSFRLGRASPTPECAAQTHRLSAFLFLGEELAESVKLSFPGRAVIANPLFESLKSRGVDAAGAYATQFFRVH